VIEATNLTDPGGVKYIRTQTAGVWSAWNTVETTKKNYIINGAMMISQENGTTPGSIVGVAYYPVDAFNCTAGTSGAINAQQVLAAAPSGSPYRLQLSVGAIDAAVGAGDLVYIDTYLEGLRVTDLQFGTANAKTVTVRFGVRAPAGTYCLVILNGAANRSYVSEYVIAAGEANTDVVRSITIPGDVTGTWPKDNTRSMTVRWGLMAGTTYQQAAGSWGTGNPVGTANQFNFMAAGNVFYLFDVSLTEGTVAPPFVVPDYASELALCQRYWQSSDLNIPIAYQGTGDQSVTMFFPVRMRAKPTGVSLPATGNFVSGIAPGGGQWGLVKQFVGWAAISSGGWNSVLVGATDYTSAGIQFRGLPITLNVSPDTFGYGGPLSPFTFNARL